MQVREGSQNVTKYDSHAKTSGEKVSLILHNFTQMLLKVVTASCWWVFLYTYIQPLVATSCSAVSTKVYSAGWINSTRCWSVQVHIFCWKLIPSPGSSLCSEFLFPYFLCDPIMTFETKLTIALAGCSGSCSANRWHRFSVSLWDFLATNPKIFAVEPLPLVHFRPCGSREQKMTVLTA